MARRYFPQTQKRKMTGQNTQRKIWEQFIMEKIMAKINQLNLKSSYEDFSKKWLSALNYLSQNGMIVPKALNPLNLLLL